MARLEKCIKRCQAMSLRGTWGCFMEHPKAAGSCRESHHRGWTYLAAQNHLLSLQIFPQQLQLRYQLLSPFSPLSQLTPQLVYCFLAAFQHLEQKMLRVTTTTLFFLHREKQIAGNVSSRKKGEEKNGSQMFPVKFLHFLFRTCRTSTHPKPLGKLLSISIWLTHQTDPIVGLARNKWTGKLTQLA